MTAYAFGDSKLKATLHQEKDHFEFELVDAASGRVWGRSPLLMLEIYAKAEFRVERVRTYAVNQVEAAPDSVHLSIGDDIRQIRVGLWLRIRNGELSVTMPWRRYMRTNRLRTGSFRSCCFPAS